jgi:hypothetical protein
MSKHSLVQRVESFDAAPVPNKHRLNIFANRVNEDEHAH